VRLPLGDGSQFANARRVAVPANMELERALAAYFERRYEPTLSLVEDLIRRRSHPQEILVLICSRLDALASSAVSEDVSKKEGFVRFVTCYGGERRVFQGVSIGDLYYELAYHVWLLPGGLIQKPGRLYRYSRLNDPVIRLLDASDIELTEEAALALLRDLMQSLRRNYRVMPGQRTTKPLVASRSRVIQAIRHDLGTPRKKALAGQVAAAVGPLLGTKTVCAILYDRFRSGVIHGGHVILDEARFFRESQPYWKGLTSPYYGSFLLVEFPARFLAAVLRHSIHTYQRHLVAKGLLPVDIYWDIFPNDWADHLGLLDPATLPEGGPVGLRVPER
jgi:hypothetical protein